MPVWVDREERRDQVIRAAIDELGEVGFSKFSLKNVGARLGGSVTLVTHYFSSRTELFGAMMEHILQESVAAVEKINKLDDAESRLATMITYFVPETPERMSVERARVGISTYSASDPEVHSFFRRLDPKMRAVVAAGLRGIVPTRNMENAIDFVRVWASGVVLLMIERAEVWEPQQRDKAVAFMREALSSFAYGRHQKGVPGKRPAESY